MARTKKTVRASEIGNYLFCQRAWWYARQGIKSRNQVELAGGAAYHEEHAGQARRILIRQIVGYLLLLAALLLMAYALAAHLLA
jgi:CRISPR/Cas system-associated exonuclease Cas4 (RecB family)